MRNNLEPIKFYWKLPWRFSDHISCFLVLQVKSRWTESVMGREPSLQWMFFGEGWGDDRCQHCLRLRTKWCPFSLFNKKMYSKNKYCKAWILSHFLKELKKRKQDHTLLDKPCRTKYIWGCHTPYLSLSIANILTQYANSALGCCLFVCLFFSWME